MIKLNKNPLPESAEIKREEDYRSGEIFNLLMTDCFGKCYICEDKEATTLHVEHRIPHKNDKKLKYDWNNLFLSCGHCNTTKGENYVEIIDPCKIDPESVLELRLETTDLTEHVVITPLTESPDVTTTVNLLENVYNGKQTAMKKAEATQLRNKISKELSYFQQYLLGNKNEPDLGYDKIITEEISRSSAFAAFKRQIIRDNKELQQQFSKALR
jgi:hypothetical protein